VDFHRLSVASWRRPARGGGRVRGIPRGGEQAIASGAAHSGRRRHPAAGDSRPRRLWARVGPGSPGAPAHLRGRRHPIARATPLGAGQFGLSFRTHTGRWEPMPVVADLTHLAHDLVGLLGPHLQRYDLPDKKSGSDHWILVSDIRQYRDLRELAHSSTSPADDPVVASPGRDRRHGRSQRHRDTSRRSRHGAASRSSAKSRRSGIGTRTRRSAGRSPLSVNAQATVADGRP
jgi:hypothetical protein